MRKRCLWMVEKLWAGRLAWQHVVLPSREGCRTRTTAKAKLQGQEVGTDATLGYRQRRLLFVSCASFIWTISEGSTRALQNYEIEESVGVTASDGMARLWKIPHTCYTVDYTKKHANLEASHKRI